MPISPFHQLIHIDGPYLDLSDLVVFHVDGFPGEEGIAIGQEVTLQVQALGSWYETRVPVIDVFDYFPTTDPREGFVLITNDLTWSSKLPIQFVQQSLSNV